MRDLEISQKQHPQPRETFFNRYATVTFSKVWYEPGLRPGGSIYGSVQVPLSLGVPKLSNPEKKPFVGISRKYFKIALGQRLKGKFC